MVRNLVFWALVVAISAALPAIGAGLDKYFMPRRERVRWYDRLLGWWLWLEDSRIGTLPAVVAAKLAAMLDWLFGEGRGVRAFAKRTIVTSVIVTLLCGVVGRAWDYGFPAALARQHDDAASYVELFLLLALANYPFNMAALATTRWSLRKVTLAPALAGMLWICLDVAIAAALAWLCAAFVVPGRRLTGFERELSLDALAWSLCEYPLWLVRHFNEFHSQRYLLMSASMLIPITLFAALLLALLLAKLALGLAKRFLQTLIEEHAPGQLPIFTALAFLASVGNALALTTLQIARR